MKMGPSAPFLLAHGVFNDFDFGNEWTAGDFLDANRRRQCFLPLPLIHGERGESSLKLPPSQGEAVKKLKIASKRRVWSRGLQ